MPWSNQPRWTADDDVFYLFCQKQKLKIIEGCGKLRALTRGICTQGSLKQLMLYTLNELQEMPDLIGLTEMGSLMIECYEKLRALPRRICKLGSLRRLTLQWLNELKEMPDQEMSDLIGHPAGDA